MSALRELVEASEAALPIIAEMFAAFPYAELDGDDAAMTRLRIASRAGRAALASAAGGDGTKIAAPFTGGALPSETSADAQTTEDENGNATSGNPLSVKK